MSETTTVVCDAVKFTAGWEPPGADPSETRAIAVMKWCETAMGARRVFVRPSFGGGPTFVGKLLTDTMDFATTHPRAGQPRYTWEPHESGCELGTYVEGANE